MRKDKVKDRAYKLAWYHANKKLKGGPAKNQNTDKTHCVRGHEFTKENTVLKTQDRKDHRLCRECRNQGSIQKSRRDRKDPNRIAAIRARRRKIQLKKIGWTPERLDLYWEAQEGKCEICNREVSREINSHHTDKAYADHEHVEPPKPRGILCVNCNLGLGNFKDSPELMAAGIAYVNKYK